MIHYGFVGLGNLGSRLASQLLGAGYKLTVFDIDEKAATALSESGAVLASTPGEVAAATDSLITCLPSPAASCAVMEGNDGALTQMRPGSTWIEMSTSDSAEIMRLADIAGKQSVKVLECPVTGGLHRAQRGEMTVFVGGDKVVYEEHLPALKAMCGPVFHIGGLGQASLLKVISNMLCLIDLVAAGEALTLAKRGGLDLATCYQAICASSGTSREFEDWAPVILNGSLNTGFTLDLALKDLGFGLQFGREFDTPLKLTGLVESMMQEARRFYGGDAWTPHVVKLMEREANTSLRADGFDDVIK